MEFYPFRHFVVRPTRATIQQVGAEAPSLTTAVVEEKDANQWTVFGVYHVFNGFPTKISNEEQAIADCPNFDFAERIREGLTQMHEQPGIRPMFSTVKVPQLTVREQFAEHLNTHVTLSPVDSQYLLDDLQEMFEDEDGMKAQGVDATFKEWNRRVGGPKNYTSYVDTLKAHARSGDR